MPSETVTVKYDTKPNSGIITRQFTVWCGICGNWELQSSMTIDSFIEQITNDKHSKWRLSRDHGWVHKSCMKIMPSNAVGLFGQH